MARKKAPVRKKPPVQKKKAKPVRTPSRVKGLPPERRSVPTSLGGAATVTRRRFAARGAGQSGDTQGLSNTEEADSESVEELVEEGQSFEASVVGGVERADAEQGEVHVREVSEDDVPGEYLDED